MLTYTTKLLTINPSLVALLEDHRTCQNFVSEVKFSNPKATPKELYRLIYRPIRDKYPKMMSQIVIRAWRSVLSAYKATKSNKHKVTKPIKFKRLSIQLDKRLYSKITNKSLRITTNNKRQTLEFQTYSKLQELFETHEVKDPRIFAKSGDLWISFTFNLPVEPVKQRLCLGVDLGIRRTAACSDGRIIIDRKFNKEKRALRYLKRCLQSKGTKSARRHLKKLRHKEKNKNKNQTHLVANEILKTEADMIVLENLKSIKVNRNKYIKQNYKSQVPFFDLRQKITYKAKNQGKTVLIVSPAYTSQLDSLTGKKDGVRKGCRYYAKSGLVYDADINAAVNIAKAAKLPISHEKLLDGQASVSRLNVCKSPESSEVLQILGFSRG